MVVLEKDEQPGHEHDHETLYTSVCATSVHAPGVFTRGQASQSSDLLCLLFHMNIDFKRASATSANGASSSEVKYTLSAASGHAAEKREKPRRARLKYKVYFSRPDDC